MHLTCTHTGIQVRFCAHCKGSALPDQRDANHPRVNANDIIGPKFGETGGMIGSSDISADDIASAYAKRSEPVKRRSKFYTGTSTRQDKPLFTAHTPSSVTRQPGEVDKAALASGTQRRGIWTRHAFSDWGKEQSKRSVGELLALARKG